MGSVLPLLIAVDGGVQPRTILSNRNWRGLGKMSCAVGGDFGRVHHGDRALALCGPSGHDLARTANRILESTRPHASGEPPVGISCFHLGPDVHTTGSPATGQHFSGRDL